METTPERTREDWAAALRRDCPSRTVVEVLASKWTLYVLAALRQYQRPMRFSELRRLLDGITQKMLTQTLRALERDGLLRRTVYPTVPPRVEYELTELGVGVGQLTGAIAEWAMDHSSEILRARQDFDDRATVPPQPVPR
ncbi:winged helix-turn-helix transcriptional regulator [Streptomyces sp. NPDC052396]|uniref:winged helix-turn-helix transcriptional regulator n=1 Tax=Streptomyces sp. NPDC052396 TaxID=3365689 RepID=UPI0037CDFD50